MHDTTWEGSKSKGMEAAPPDLGLLTKVFETIPIAITVVDAGDKITFANRKAEEILGLSKSKITGRIYNDPKWRIATIEGGSFQDEEFPFQRVRDTGEAVENVRYAIVLPDERTVCLSINASPLTDGKGGFAGMVAVIEDVTAVYENELALKKQKRANRVLVRCNKALVSAAAEVSLLEEICRIIVEDGGYRLAWVGYAEEDGGRTVKPVAEQGFEEGYLDSITITWDETDTGRGPTGTAIRTGQPTSARNILSDPAYEPWRAEALKRGYASSLALPLIVNNHRLGALNIYAAEPDSFDAEEVELLIQMAEDLAYGIDDIRIREEQKQILVELKASQEDWRRIFNSISDPVMILDLDQNILVANPAAEKKLELTLDRILGRKSYDVFRFLDEAAEVSPFKSLIESGGAVTTDEMEIEAVGGTFLVTVSPIFNSEGRLSKVLHIAKDITERKQAEEALRLFRALLDQSTDGIEVIDPETGKFLEVNERSCLTHGYSKEELLDLRIFDIDPTVDPSEYKKTLEYLRQTGSMLWQGYHRRKDGTNFPVEVAIRYVKLDRDYMISIVRDITERSRVEDAIRESEEKQRLILQNIDEIVYMVVTEGDPLKGNVTFVSNQVENITGYTPRDFVEDPAAWFENIHPDDIQSVTNTTIKLYEDKNGLTRFYRLKHKVTGEYKWLEDKVVPKLDKNGDVTGHFGVVRDVTERIQTEKDLVKSYETLRNTFDGVVRALASTAESRDPYTAGHQERVSRLAAAIAQELRLSKDQIKGIRVAGLLHDLGKMSVPVEILGKPGKINDFELNIIKLHTTVGNDILSSIEFPWPVARIAHQHHERIDGSGYPLGLNGDEISLEARILAVADVVEAMSSHRPYRAARGIDEALDEIAKQSGILYDPDVAEACLRLFREKGYKLD